MCGIIGMISAKNGFYGGERDQFKHMLLLTSLRGSHSTGLIGIDTSQKDNDVSIIKSIGNPYDLLSYEKSDKFFNQMVSDYDMVVGHCRYATRGEINAVNAHPFKEDYITLVHNGVINNFNYLHDAKKHADIVVDSHLIARLIADEGPEEVLPRVSGAFVFVWHDASTGNLRIARNKERPLWFGRHKNRDVLSFASEPETLIWNATRNKNPLQDVFECEPFQILDFAKGSLEPVDVREFKPRVTYYQQPTRMHPYQDFRDDDDYFNQGREFAKQQNQKSFKDKRKYRLNESQEEDNLIFERTAVTHGLTIGQEVEFVVDDFKEIRQHGTNEYITTSIWGESDDFPNVQFMCNSRQVSDDELVECIGLRGIVSSIVIVPATATPNRQQYRIFVNNFILIHNNLPVVIDADEDIQKELSLDDLVSVANFDGGTVVISKEKFVKVCDDTCSICYAFISDKQRSRSEKLIFIEGKDGAEDGIVCEKCSQEWIDVDKKSKKGKTK